MLEALKYEWNLLTRERLLFLIVMMIAASTYALMIGNLYWGGTVQRIPTAVCDLEDSALSREFIRAVADVDQLNYVETLNDDMAALDRLENNKAAVVLVIPKDFSARFYSNRPIETAALQDGSNVVQTTYALPQIQSVVGYFAAKMSVRASAIHSTPQLSPMPVSMSLRTFGNPTQSYLEFYIFGVLLMAAQIGVMFNFSMSIFRDKKILRRSSRRKCSPRRQSFT